MNNEELLAAIKGVATEGADLSAIETGLNGINPLTGVNDKDSALKLIRDNPFLNSAYDSGISKGVDSFKTKYTSDELPGLIESERKKIMAELNPDETEATKVAREFAEYKAAQELKEQKGALRNELIKTFDTVKAVDNGFKAEDLKFFVDMGEGGIDQFKKMNERISEITKTKIELALKGKFNTGNPGGGDQEPQTFKDPLEGQNWMDK